VGCWGFRGRWVSLRMSVWGCECGCGGGGWVILFLGVVAWGNLGLNINSLVYMETIEYISRLGRRRFSNQLARR
jgi:hypothetical protein